MTGSIDGDAEADDVGGNSTVAASNDSGGGYESFVGHTGTDAAKAERIAWHLEARARLDDRPAREFIQAWDVVPGRNWTSSTHRALPTPAQEEPVRSPAYLADSRYGNAEWAGTLAGRTHPAGSDGETGPPLHRRGRLPQSITYINPVGRDEPTVADTPPSVNTASVEGRAKPSVAFVFPGRGGGAARSGVGPLAIPGPVGSPVTSPAGTGSVGAGQDGPASAGSPGRSGPTSPRLSHPASGFGTGTGPETVTARKRSGGPWKAAHAKEPGEPAVTVLHISDTQFGAHHVFGKVGLTEADRAHSSLFGRLHDDLRDRAETDGLRPDLVVITGDLAETGTKREFEQVFDFLVALTDALGLSRDRVCVVPGNRDVNRKLCAAHFLQCEGQDELPVPPYWPKWTYFDALLRRFYGADAEIGFRVGAEWSLFEVPEHRVVVAGLNSTMAETHDVHHGWLGEHQLRWFADALRRHEREGWLRIGALHHNPIRGATSDDENLRDVADLDRILGPRLNLLLHGHTHDGRSGWLSSGLPVVSTGSAAVDAPARPSEVPNQYQLIRVDRDGFTRYARRYELDQRRWTGDLRVDPAGDSWSVRTPCAFLSVDATFPPSAFPRHPPRGGYSRDADYGDNAPGWHRSGRPWQGPGQDHVGADPDESPVRLDVQARTDSTLGVGDIAPVTVLLSRLPLLGWPSVVDAGGVARASSGVPVIVEIVPRANLEVVGPTILETAVPDSEQVDALVFHIRATDVGRGELWVVVRQASEFLLAPLVLAPEVTPSAPAPDPAELAAEGTVSSHAKPSDAPALHVLRINEERHGDTIVYRYDLEAHDLELLAAFASRPIIGDRDAYVRRLYKRIEGCWVTSQRDEEKFGEELRAFGADLLDELVPPDLQRLLWENRRRLGNILVLSTEPFIPWELLHLKDPSSRRLPRETCFLGQLGVVRWVWGPYPSTDLRLRPGRARHIVPDYPHPERRLPEAAAERMFLENVIGATAVTPHHREVLAALRDNDIDLLHFSGHGVASTDNIADAHLLLEGLFDGNTYVEEPLRVSAVRQNFDRNGPEDSHPIVVVNACQAGRLGGQLSTIGGFSEAFVRGGAGAFVGCLWSVGDVPARDFIVEFYERLLAGETVSQATVAGREKAREAGDATWLAYTVYAHPRARLVSDSIHHSDRNDDPTN